MRARVFAAAFAAGLAGSLAAAQAAPGVVSSGANLRAGPGPDYPLVAELAPGTSAVIFGCESGWGWCDVGLEGGLRGWVSGRHLEVVYDGRPALLPEGGAAVGVPFVGFDVDDYWGRNYRGRPWYGSEARWRGRPDGNGPGRFDGPGRFGGRERGGPPGRADERGPERGPAPSAGPGRGPGPGPAGASRGGERGGPPRGGDAGHRGDRGPGEGGGPPR